MKQTRKTNGRVLSPSFVTLRVRRGRRDHRDLVRLGDRRHRERAARGDLAEQHRHLVLRGRGAFAASRGLLGLALVVVGLEVELLALHAALRVQLLDRELDPLVGRVAEGRLRAGHRADVAEPDLRSGCGSLRGCGGGRLRGLLLLAGGDGEEQRGGGDEGEGAAGAHGGSSGCGNVRSCSTVSGQAATVLAPLIRRAPGRYRRRRAGEDPARGRQPGAAHPARPPGRGGGVGRDRRGQGEEPRSTSSRSSGRPPPSSTSSCRT